MIKPSSPTTASDVAKFYDEHDFFYRHLWGDQVHHGFWNDREDKSSVEEATSRLLYLTTRPLRLLPGQTVADIGCGYGTSTIWLAETFGTDAIGFNLSGIQTNAARNRPAPERGHVRIEARNWLDNHLEDHSLDAALAIESLGHMPDKASFFAELKRTLKPGGMAGIACWTASHEASGFETFLLRGLCKKGCLGGLGTIDQYKALATDAGLEIAGCQEATKHVSRTWSIIARRAIGGLFSNRKFLGLAIRRTLRAPLSIFALPQLLFAYRTGALRYHFLWVGTPKREPAPDPPSDRQSETPSEDPSEDPSEEPFEMPPLAPFKPPSKRSGVHRGIGALVKPAPLQGESSASTPSAKEPD